METVGAEISEPIIPPPPAELDEFYELVLRGDMRLLKEKAKHIETLGTQYIPFARRLHSLAQGFQEHAIKVFVEKYRDKKAKTITTEPPTR